ncbi:MAG TPA: cysteine desulfurase-like protein [Candidatus Dormibacteraeota bacterium]|nr:cysteine desulfurase-like protein [Candidatus Dormibacteraeota bacterium]
MSSVASLEQIRSHFPALERRHRGHPVAYFDGPGGTQVPRAVTEAMTDYLLHHNANTHWAYPTSQETDQALLDARAALADWIGGAPEEIVFGANMTTLTFHLGRALGRQWRAGDVVVVTELDHHANSDTWRALAQERGVEIRTVRMRREDGCLDEDDLAQKLTGGTRLLAVGAASNALGTINDLPRLVERAHAVGALAFVDGVHYSAHHIADVRAWGCDFYACSAYKFYGPHVGVLWGRRELIEGLDAPRLAPATPSAPDRLETGTLNHEGMVGAGAAVDFLASLAGSAGARRARLTQVSRVLEERGAGLLRQLWEGLRSIRGVQLYGLPPGDRRTATLSFTLAGVAAEKVAVALAAEGVFVSSGDFYAATVTRVLGHEHDGLVRAGCAAYTSAEEVERLIAAVRRLA